MTLILPYHVNFSRASQYGHYIIWSELWIQKNFPIRLRCYNRIYSITYSHWFWVLRFH